MKVSELTGALLDYWVAKAEGSRGPEYLFQDGTWHATDCGVPVFYSRNWAQAGPIIERARIDLKSPPNIDAPDEHSDWAASVDDRSVSYTVEWYGETPLLAAMRAYVASKFGADVDG